jgi:hypothetical protein
VTKNGKALLWMAALISVILYIYAISEFALLRDDISVAKSEFHMYCGSTWQVRIRMYAPSASFVDSMS